MTDKRPCSGDLLIAPPSMNDPSFARSVLLLLSGDTSSGTIALCVNRKLNITVDHLDLDLEYDLDLPLFWGGPLLPQSIWMLHTSEWGLPATRDITDEWSVTSDHDMFPLLAAGSQPEYFRLFLGYSGWQQGQLLKELEGTPPWSRRNSWLVAKSITPQWLFDRPHTSLWREAISQSCQQAVASWL